MRILLIFILDVLSSINVYLNPEVEGTFFDLLLDIAQTGSVGTFLVALALMLAVAGDIKDVFK